MIPPLCTVCQVKPCLWSKTKNSYLEWCSPTCRGRHPRVEAKRKQTCLEKYGDITSARNAEVKKKKDQTCKERYGHKSPSLNEEIRKKQKATLLKKYGVTSIHESDIIQQKRKNTLKQRYGTDNFGKIKHLNPDLYSQSRETRLNNWLPMRWEGFKDIAIPLYTVDEFNNIFQLLPYICVKCNNTFTDTLRDGKIPRCLACYPLNQTNWNQQELVDWIKSIVGNVQVGNRKIIAPQELDIYVPDGQLAIEYNGLYWHSDIGSNHRITKKYHLDKTTKCLSQGISLIHIFEDEWIEKKEIVKSLIQSKLNIFDTVIYARKCNVRLIDSKTCNMFLSKTHLQGQDKSSVRIGLFFQDELVSVMTFGTPRFSKHHQWELIRYSTALNTRVVGGASKLLKFFIDQYNPTSILSYADRRYSVGTVYEKLGFTLTKTNPPAYFYVNLNEGCARRYSRVKFQKHKLAKILTNYDPSCTEEENMNNNGFAKIWDCGTLVYVLKP